jgi:hypothetical protein
MSEHKRNHDNTGRIGVGISMVNVLGNLAYAGMRAQGSTDTFGRAFAFVLGFPGSLLTYFVVD